MRDRAERAQQGLGMIGLVFGLFYLLVSFLGHAQTLASQLAPCLRPRANPRSYLQEAGHVDTIYLFSSVTCWAFEPGLLSVVSVLGFRADAHVAFS